MSACETNPRESMQNVMLYKNVFSVGRFVHILLLRFRHKVVIVSFSGFRMLWVEGQQSRCSALALNYITEIIKIFSRSALYSATYTTLHCLLDVHNRSSFLMILAYSSTVPCRSAQCLLNFLIDTRAQRFLLVKLSPKGFTAARMLVA